MLIDIFNLPVPNIGRAAADGLVHARDLLGYVFGRFFAPMAVAREPVIERERRFEFLRWFRIVEEMVRRILFIEASAIATSLPPAAPPRARSKQKPRQAPAFDGEDIQTWRPSFRMTLPLARPDQPKRQGVRHAPSTVCPSRPLALRMQAVLQVAYDPHPFIQRLARRLRGGLQRFARLATYTPCFYGRATPTLRDLSAACAPRFTDSS